VTSLPRTIPSWLKEVTDSQGVDTALRDVEGAVISYADLYGQTYRIAEQLRDAGIGRNDAVLLVLPDGVDLVITLLGVVGAAAAFPVSAHEAPERYVALLGQVDLKAVVCGPRLRDVLSAECERRGIALATIRTAGSVRSLSFVDKPRVARTAGGAPQLADTALLVGSSGATASPKIIAVSHESVFASLERQAIWCGLTERDRSLCIMPLSHLHGLFRSTLSVLFKGGSVVCAPGFDEHRVLEWIEEWQPTYMTAAPSLYRSMLRRLAERGRSLEHPAFRLLVTGSDKVDPALPAEVEAAFGAPLVLWYGVSEAAPLFTGTTPGDSAKWPGSVGAVNAPWTIAILDEKGVGLPPGAVGEIAAKGGLLNPTVGKDAVPHRITIDGYFRTGDLGRLDGDGHLYVLGRADDRIHRGAEKIDPSAVEAVLVSHSAVAEAVVFPVPDDDVGQRVGAALVLKFEASATIAEVQAFAAARLFAYMVPERIVFVDRLPVSATGKLSRTKLAEVLGLAVGEKAVAATSPAVTAPSKVEPPSDETERHIWEMFSSRLQREDFGRDDGFIALGGDSFGAIEILMEIEDHFGVSIPPATFFGGNSVAALAELVREASDDEPRIRLIPVGATGRNPPVFIPYTREGRVGFTAAIRNALGEDQPLYAFHAARSEDDPAQLRTFQETASEMIGLLRAVQPEGPYYLLGYSFASHLCLEIAQQLMAGGEKVAFFGVIDDGLDLERRQFDIENQKPKSLTTFTCNRWAIQRYVPRSYAGTVILFRAAEPAEEYQTDPYGGWGDIATGGVEVFDIPGDHESVVTEQGFLAWAPHLSIALAKARHAAASRRVRRAAGTLPRPKGSRQTEEARAAAKRGDRKTEIAEYRRAIALGPQPAWVHANLGRALMENGDTDDALKAMEEAVDLDPWPMWRMAQLCADLARLKRHGIAELHVRARGLLADDPDTYRHYAHICRLAGHLDEAEAVVRAGIRLDTRRVYTGYRGGMHLYLAELLQSRGRQSEAAAEASTAVSFAMAPSQIVRAARVQINAGYHAEAAASFRKALRYAPDFGEAKAGLAELGLTL
jgi:acyl-CoA synthetase (AMP-forming)/AMP-acid ligase II/thioesterase domain-containing protein/acyl carrier protein/Flp pilus assembly protein TadD